MSKPQAAPPHDKWKFVYIIFYWLGICTLLPWNFFISVPGYWAFKYRDVLLNGTASSTQTELQMNWNPRLSVASMVPNVTFLTLNAVFGHRFKTKPRLFFSLVMVILLFTYTCAMAKVNTDDWQETFFNVTLVSVVCINIFAAIFQGGLLGVAGKFPPNYIGGVFSGQALGGIFSSLTNIAMLALGASDQNSGFFSFIIACVFLILSLGAFLFVTKTDFYEFYNGETNNSNVLEVNPDGDKLMEKGPGAPEGGNSPKVNPLLILREIWVYALSIFIVFAVTLSCFPGVTAAIQSTAGGTWGNKFFVPVTCFLLFNVGDYIGRSLAEFLQFPKPSLPGGSLFVLLAALARIVFIPLFLFCNVSPLNRHVTYVAFESDTLYIILMLLFSISNGYISSICMMMAPGIIKKPEEQATAASLMVACLGVGLGLGAGLSNALVLLF